MRFGIKFQIGRKDIVIDEEIEKARIEYEKGQESLWSRSWNHEIESIDAIGAVLYDEAEYFAEADELPDFLRDFCRGISGEHTKTTIPGLLGAGVVGLAKSGAEGETVRLEAEAVSDVSKRTKATSKIAEVEDGINAVEKAGVEVGKISEAGSSVDIKNYNVETANGRSNLVNNISKQYYQRSTHLPQGTKQSVMIDVRGQNVSNVD